MKRIRKSTEPAALLVWKVGKQWRQGLPPWENFDTTTVRIPLRDDQRSLCCYCCASIANDAFHIEHFQPQSAFPNLRYEWSNMLASCESFQKATFNGVPVQTQVHCGHCKDDAVIAANPIAAGVEDEFLFGLDGQIHPSKKLTNARYAIVEEAIAILNLRAPSLVARRQAALAKASEDTERLDEAAWRGKYLDLLPDGTFQEFWPALSYAYKRYKTVWWPPV